MDYDDAEEFSEEAKELFSEKFNAYASDKLQRIYEALRLDEIGL
jgi:hypothetical protein